jgi:hypothetical protein
MSRVDACQISEYSPGLFLVGSEDHDGAALAACQVWRPFDKRSQIRGNQGEEGLHCSRLASPRGYESALKSAMVQFSYRSSHSALMIVNKRERC